MGLAERAELIVNLRLQDQLTSGLATAKGELASLEGQAARTTTGIAGLGSSFGNLLKIGAASFAAFKVVDVLSDAITAASEEEVSIARLTASIQANDKAWSGNQAAIEDVLQSRMRLGHSDDEQRESLSRLVAATHNVNEALDLERTAMDLAAFKRIDLAAASEALVRVESGRYRALADLGIQIKANATQEEALAEVQKVVQGSAEALANTTSGKLTAANVKLGEAMEKIGGVLLPPLADGMGVLADVVGGAADVFKGFGDILGGVGNTIGGVVDDLNKLGNANTQEAQATIAYNLALDELQRSFADGKITQDEYIAKSRQLADSFDAAAQSSQGFTTASEASGVALDNIAGRAIAAAQAARQLDAEITNNSVSFRSFTTDAGETGAGLDNLQNEAIAAAHGLDTTRGAIVDAAGAADAAKGSVQNLADVLAALPTTITIDIKVRQTLENAAAGAGATAAQSLGPGQGVSAVNTDPFAIEKAQAEAAAEAQRKAEQAAREAASAAKQRAQEIAQANREKVAASYDDVRRAADHLFDVLHDRHIKAIQDAEKLAQKNHDATIQRINDALAAQEAENAKPVNAAQAAQTAKEQAEQRRNLVEAVQAAQEALQKNGDPTQAAQLAKALRDAQEALQNFDARAVISRLQTTQAAADAQAEAQAQKDRDKADAELEAAKAKAAAQEQAVTAADKKKQQEFDIALAALRKKDENDPAKFLNDVKALEARFGIFTDAAGFRHIGDQVAAAVEKIQVRPTINLTTQPQFILQLGPTAIRGIAAAVQSLAQPAATAGVRNGQNGRAG